MLESMHSSTADCRSSLVSRRGTWELPPAFVPQWQVNAVGVQGQASSFPRVLGAHVCTAGACLCALGPWDLVGGKCRLRQVQRVAPGISVVLRKWGLSFTFSYSLKRPFYTLLSL